MTCFTIDEARAKFARCLELRLCTAELPIAEARLPETLKSLLAPHRSLFAADSTCALEVRVKLQVEAPSSGHCQGASGELSLPAEWSLRPTDDLLRALREELGHDRASLLLLSAGPPAELGPANRAALKPLIAALDEPALAQALAEAARIWVASSGGADSTALLLALVYSPYANKVQVTHVNHGVQADAEDWAGQVGELCANLRVPLDVFAVPEPATGQTRDGFRSMGARGPDTGTGASCWAPVISCC